MHYDEFRAAWNQALHQEQVLSFNDRPEETLDLGTMSRRYSIRIRKFGGAAPEPFHVSMLLEWEWNALKSARTCTTEEDLVHELLGRRGRVATDRPMLRVDVGLAAMLPLEHPIHVPGADAWCAWVEETRNIVRPLLPPSKVRMSREGLPIAECWLGEPEGEVKLGPDGNLELHGVRLKAWQGIHLPRQWDDRSRRPDLSPRKQLERFARQLRDSLDAWARSLRLLLVTPTREKPGRRLH